MVRFYVWCVKVLKFNTLAGLGFVGHFMYIYIYIYMGGGGGGIPGERSCLMVHTMSGKWLQMNIIDIFNQEHTPLLSRAVVFGG